MRPKPSSTKRSTITRGRSRAWGRVRRTGAGSARPDRSEPATTRDGVHGHPQGGRDAIPVLRVLSGGGGAGAGDCRLSHRARSVHLARPSLTFAGADPARGGGRNVRTLPAFACLLYSRRAGPLSLAVMWEE